MRGMNAGRKKGRKKGGKECAITIRSEKNCRTEISLKREIKHNWEEGNEDKKGGSGEIECERLQ